MTAAFQHNTDRQYEQLFREYYTSLCYFAQKYLGDLDSSKEVVHALFVSIWEKRDAFDFEKSAKSYLFTSVYNRCMNYLRDRKKFKDSDEGIAMDLQDAASLNHDHLETAELESRIWQGIQQLPEKCREVFTLNRFEDKKYAEIAEVLNISVKTVEAQMSKALKHMREHLSDYLQIVVLILFKKFW